MSCVLCSHPDLSFLTTVFVLVLLLHALLLPGRCDLTWPLAENEALSGGSLGSCIDEERSQLRELM